MFPSIFIMSIEGLGPLTGDGSGILVAAIVGGAIIPEVQGVIADHIGIHHAFFLPALCYIYIAYLRFAARAAITSPSMDRGRRRTPPDGSLSRSRGLYFRPISDCAR